MDALAHRFNSLLQYRTRAYEKCNNVFQNDHVVFGNADTKYDALIICI